MSWSPAQYAAFEADRTRPSRDLVAAIPEPPAPGTSAPGVSVSGVSVSGMPVSGTSAGRMCDLGCGPGNSTEVLAARFPQASVEGVDSSPDMIAAARARLPGLRFTVADIQAWDDPGPFVVLLANAVLQWLPDHAALLPRLAGRLAPGGSLAVQMPDNLDEPAHRLMRDVAADGPWAAKLAGAAGMRAVMGTPDDYYRMLRPHCRQVDVWRTIYHHVLPAGADGVVEWFKGSGLRPFLAPLDPAEQAAFLDRYRAAVAQAYPALPDGAVLLPFPRLFMVGTR